MSGSDATAGDGVPAPARAGVTRRAVLGGAGGLAVAGALAPAAAEAAAVRVIGRPHDGIPAAEVFGQIAQDGERLAGYGYLTRVAGLRDGVLFAGAQTEAGARFTFTADARVRSRFAHGQLIAVTGTGSMRLYVGDGGGDFGAPGSFAGGRLVAAFAARFQNVLTITAPDTALTVIKGELVQERAPGFAFRGARYRFGARGLRLQLSATGPGHRTDPTAPRAVFDVAGRIDAAR